MATYRVRKLMQYGAGEVARSPTMGRATRSFMAMSDQAGAVYDVAASDLSYEGAELTEALRSGELSSGDLVHYQNRWITLLDHPDVSDVAELAFKREQRAQFVKYALIALASLAIPLAYIVLRIATRG